MQPVQLLLTPRMQPLVPIHRTALARMMTIRRHPTVHPVAIRAVQLGLRQPFVELQESLSAAVANLKIGLPTAIRLPHHRCPDPQILPLIPPPSLPVSPHLSKSSHRRRPVAYHAGSAFLPPPAHPRQCGRPYFLTHLDRRRGDPESPGNGTQGTALPVHRQGAFLVGGAGSLGRRYRGWCGLRSRRSDRPGDLWMRRLWASNWSRIRGRGHRGDRRGGGPCWYFP